MGVLNNLGFLNSIRAYPCAEPNPILFIGAGAVAGSFTLLELESWSCRDIIKLRAGISYRCGKVLKAVIKAAHGADYIDTISKVHKFIGPAEKLLWYWFVADLATGFVAHWTSLIYQLQGCAPLSEGATWQGKGYPPELLIPGRPWPISATVENYKGKPGFATSTGCIVPHDYYVSIDFIINYKPLAPDRPVSVTTSVTQQTHGTFQFGGNNYPHEGGNEVHKAHYGFYHKAPHDSRNVQYTMTVESDDYALAWIEEAHVTVSPIEILEQQMFGVGCFNRDWSIERRPGRRLGRL